MRSAVVFTVLASLSLPALAQSGLGFKDVVLGQPLGHGPVAKRLECRPSSCWYMAPRSMEALRAKNYETIGGYMVSTLSVDMHDEKVDRIAVSFHTNGFDNVRAGLAEKYPALKCEAGSVQNRAGATFDQVVCSVTDATGELQLLKRSGKIDDAALTIVSKAHVERSKMSRQKAQKDI